MKDTEEIEYKRSLIRVSEFTQDIDGEESTFYKIDVYDDDGIVITSAEMIQLQELLNTIEVKV